MIGILNKELEISVSVREWPQTAIIHSFIGFIKWTASTTGTCTCRDHACTAGTSPGR